MTMRLLPTTLTLLVLLFWQFPAAAKDPQLPEAYAGLPADAYHLMELSGSAKNGQVLTMGKHSWTLDTQAAAQNKTGNNFSFKQAIPGGFIAATQGENSLFGTMHLDNQHHIITTNQSGIWAVALPETGLSYNDCGLDHAPEDALENAAFSKTLSTQPPVDPQVAGTVIDVLVIYDQAIADRYPGDLLDTRVAQYFNVSNQTYANSSLDLAIRLVGLEQVGYNFDDSNQALRNLMRDVLHLGIGTLGLENLPQLYNETGADLVIFLRTHNIETRGSCGIAFFPIGDGQGGLDSSYGVNVMADGMSSWSLCTDQLMVHEIGHNLSAGHHNWDPTEFGYDARARGFAKLGQFGTVMGSFGTGTVDRFLELDYFSNPNIQCGGGPCGEPGTRDNVAVINIFKDFVASYQDSISSAPMPADFTAALIDQDGDGVLDRDDHFPYDANETFDSDGDGVGDVADQFPQDASEQTDFDNDGIGDNADFDDDNDGILDNEDDFPQNPNEVKDSDQDGVGDIADDFVFEQSEFRDFDQDGIGNHADEDDDNDGVVDIANGLYDLLVISVGNNRILRFDAQTGLPKGIEVLPDDGLLTFQSDLAYDDRMGQLFYSSESSIKTLDLMDRSASPELFLPPYSDSQAALGTGFPTALLTDDNNGLYIGKLRAKSLTNYTFTNFNNPNVFFDIIFPIDEEASENIIDLYKRGDEIFLLGQGTPVYRGNLNGSNLMQVGNANMPWLVDPYAFVVTDDDLLLHTDQGRDKIVITDANTGTFEGIFADLAALGYSNPTGIELTDSGRLLVAVSDQNAILEFDVNTQAFVGELVRGAGLDQPHKMLLVPQLADRFPEDADKVIRPNAGNWFNPVTSGRGFNIGIFDNRLQVLWFTYDDAGLPIWYTSADLLVGDTYTTDLLKTTQINDSSVTVDVVGSITLAFHNERQATFTWELGADSGQENIEWLPFSAEPEVENYTGMWSRPDTPGWGMAVVTIGDKNITIPFIYDSDGEPRWAISDVQSGTSPFDFNMVTVFSDTLCPGCSGTPATTVEASGSMQLQLNGDAEWNSALDWADPVPGDWLLNQTEIIRISSEPTRPR